MNFFARLFCRKRQTPLEQLEALRGTDAVVDELFRRTEAHVHYCRVFGFEPGSPEEQTLCRLEGDWFSRIMTRTVMQRLDERSAQRIEQAQPLNKT